MKPIIVQTSKNVTLVGAGQVNKGIFDTALRISPYIVAADGGAEMVLNYGRTPKKVIGDLDSLSGAARAKIPPEDIHQLENQDSTDFEKCLQTIRAPLILGVGFLGKRLDHQLAALSALVKYPEKRCILMGKQDLVFHLSGTVNLMLDVGSRFSLFPLVPVRVSSKGLAWPTESLNFAPGGQIGTSNRVTDGAVQISANGPGMLVILPPAALASAVDALAKN